MKSVFSSSAFRAAILLIVVGYMSVSHAKPNDTVIIPGSEKSQITVYSGKNPANSNKSTINSGTGPTEVSKKTLSKKTGPGSEPQFITPSERAQLIKNNQISKTQLHDLHVIIGCEREKLCSYKIMDERPVPAFVVYVPQEVWAQIRDKKNAKAYFDEVIHTKIRQSKQIQLDEIETAEGNLNAANSESKGNWFTRLFSDKNEGAQKEEKYTAEQIKHMEDLHLIEVQEAGQNKVLHKYQF